MHVLTKYFSLQAIGPTLYTHSSHLFWMHDQIDGYVDVDCEFEINS